MTSSTGRLHAAGQEQVDRQRRLPDLLLPAQLAPPDSAMDEKARTCYRNQLSGECRASRSAAGPRPRRALLASTSSKGPSTPAPNCVATVDTAPDKTRPTFDHDGSLGPLHRFDHIDTEVKIATVAAVDVDVDMLAELLQREEATVVYADWIGFLYAGVGASAIQRRS